MYLYRDPDTNEILYVGKGTGKRVDAVVKDIYECPDPELRAQKLDIADKRRVRQWFSRLERQGKAPLIEIMPCVDSAQALAVEAALISALWDDGLLNRVHGHKQEFAPLGLPRSTSRRRFEPALTRSELASVGGAIAVYISPNRFFEGDARLGAVPRLALSERQQQWQRDDAHRRIRRWWQVGRHVESWAERPDDAPRVLVAVTGPPARRWVWAATELDSSGWVSITREHLGLYELPTKRSAGITDRDLDAVGLRGRRVGHGEIGPVLKNGHRQFGGIRSQFIDVIPATA